MALSPGGNQVFESMVGALHSSVLVKEAKVVPTNTNQNPPASEKGDQQTVKLRINLSVNRPTQLHT